MTRVLASEPHCKRSSGSRRLGGLVLAVALSLACTTVSPNLAEHSAELTGPFPEDYVEIVRRWIDSDFLDLSSVTSLEVSPPIAGRATRWPSDKRLNGWYAKVSFRARDSVGANKGKMVYSVLLREGAIVSYSKLLY